MKLLVVYGVHSTETGGVRICNDLRKKNYEELNQLAGRKFTEKEVLFLNVSRHSPHSKLKNFMEDYAISSLLKLFEKHAYELPAEYGDFLRGYVHLWTKSEGYTMKELEQIKESATSLLPKVPKGIALKGGIKTIFPAELHSFMFYPDMSYSPERYLRLQSVKEALDAGDFIIDIHCTHNLLYRHNEPYEGGVSTPIYLEKKLFKWGGSLPAILQKYRYLSVKHSVLECNHPFSVFLVEIKYRGVEKKISELYKGFTKKPNVFFLELLHDLCTKEDYVNFCDRPFYYLRDAISSRGDFTDPELYMDEEQFNEAKRMVANLIADLFGWGEKYENKTN